MRPDYEWNNLNNFTIGTVAENFFIFTGSYERKLPIKKGYERNFIPIEMKTPPKKYAKNACKMTLNSLKYMLLTFLAAIKRILFMIKNCYYKKNPIIQYAIKRSQLNCFLDECKKCGIKIAAFAAKQKRRFKNRPPNRTLISNCRMA